MKKRRTTGERSLLTFSIDFRRYSVQQIQESFPSTYAIVFIVIS
ncbi:hypothetical protein [Nostoc flagelliforme]|nr:hypothetical protein [Nostoc flagelliforme]